MGFRFRKRIKIAPGVAINLSKSGVSASLGGKGLTYNTRGKVTAGLPGTGLSYSANLTSGRSRTSSSEDRGPSARQLATSQTIADIFERLSASIRNCCASHGAYIDAQGIDAGLEFLYQRRPELESLRPAMDEILTAGRLFGDMGSLTAAGKERALRALYKVEEALAANAGETLGVDAAAASVWAALGERPKKKWVSRGVWSTLALIIFGGPLISGVTGMDPGPAFFITILISVGTFWGLRRGYRSKFAEAEARIDAANARFDQVVEFELSPRPA
ncbi:DUF4236 domain-containing protein [Cupriavidus agavae]|uniref:Uncharacterized protein DUF4236 n=1 Tax=Cupriavidus agavae TaxID=1001822 RepID=A0A4Q7RRD9_9BURK|nr:DUF4236 domain-containing protein [Cupriavidus agavae]RZT35507.1 uncharacterized protein DUF4236 [Cupriavidus agavae]